MSENNEKKQEHSSKDTQERMKRLKMCLLRKSLKKPNKLLRSLAEIENQRRRFERD